MPFPGVGPLTITTDADIFKGMIDKLTASGGGDIPELSLSGLQVLRVTDFKLVLTDPS